MKSKVKSKKPKAGVKKHKAKARPKEKVIGKIEHIFGKINVITTTLKNPLKVGDIIHIKGHTTDIVQAVDSIQIEHEKVLKAKKGDGIGIKVAGDVRDTDIIYLADKKTAAAVNKPAVPLTQTAYSAVPQRVPQITPILLSGPAPLQVKTTPVQPIIQRPQAPQIKKPEAKKPEPPKFMAF